MPSCAPAIEYVTIPEGSSSAAPVIRPGPRTDKKRFSRFFLVERGIYRFAFAWCKQKSVSAKGRATSPWKRPVAIGVQKASCCVDLLRFFRAALAPSFPRAIRVLLGRCAIVLFRRAARAAFLIFCFAAAGCFLVATISPNRICLTGSSIRRESCYISASALSCARCLLRGGRARMCRASACYALRVSRQRSP